MKERWKRLSAAVIGTALFLSGCATTSTVTEYDLEGRVTRITVTERDPFDKVTDSTREKSVVAWSNGWAAYIRAGFATVETPTPSGEIYAGKVAGGVLALHKDQRNADGIPAIIAATREEVSVSFDGMSSRGEAEEPASVPASPAGPEDDSGGE